MSSRTEILNSDDEDEGRDTGNRLTGLRRIRALMNHKAHMSIHTPLRLQEINTMSKNIKADLKKYGFPSNMTIHDIDEFITDENSENPMKKKFKESSSVMREHDAAQKKHSMNQEKHRYNVYNTVANNRRKDDQDRQRRLEIEEAARHRRETAQKKAADEIRMQDLETAAILLSISKSEPPPNASDASEQAAVQVLTEMYNRFFAESRKDHAKTHDQPESDPSASMQDYNSESPKHKKTKTFTVERIVGYNPYNHTYEIKWDGHPTEENTMEPAENMEDDIPQMVAAFRLRQEEDRKRRR